VVLAGRMHVVAQIMANDIKTNKDAKTFALKLMTKLEADATALGNPTSKDGKTAVESLAFKVFADADAALAAGRADEYYFSSSPR
jgi:hypothetical protein